MPYNPMPTRKEWQQEKKKHGIPDKIIKSGSFGEKAEKLQKKFGNAGVAKVTTANATALIASAGEADVLLDEWLTAAKARKAADFTNRAEAIKTVEGYKTAVKLVREMAEAALNPIGISKANWKKFEARWNAAKRDPNNVEKLAHMYSQGIRNDIGQGFHDAYKMRAVLHLPTNVEAKIVEYEATAAKWHDLVDDTDPLDDATQRVKFWKDMTKAANLGKQIIQLNG